MQIPRSFAFLLLMALPVAAGAQAISRVDDACPLDGASPPVVQVSKGVQLVKLSDELAIEKLTDDAALTHFWNLLSRRPEAFVEARRVIAQRGWRTTDRVYVERTIVTTTSHPTPGNGAQALLAAYAEGSAQGEITIWSADDGNSSNWEGTIYMEVYSDGAASTWQGQIDVSTTSYPWIWYQKTWEKQPIDKQASFDLPPSGASVAPAAFLGSYGVPGDYRLAVNWINWANCWRAGVIGGCTGAAVACRFSGPAWPGCFGAWCVGVEVGSGITCYLQNRN